MSSETFQDNDELLDINDIHDLIALDPNFLNDEFLQQDSNEVCWVNHHHFLSDVSHGEDQRESGDLPNQGTCDVNSDKTLLSDCDTKDVKNQNNDDISWSNFMDCIKFVGADNNKPTFGRLSPEVRAWCSEVVGIDENCLGNELLPKYIKKLTSMNENDHGKFLQYNPILRNQCSNQDPILQNTPALLLPIFSQEFKSKKINNGKRCHINNLKFIKNGIKVMHGYYVQKGLHVWRFEILAESLPAKVVEEAPQIPIVPNKGVIPLTSSLLTEPQLLQQLVVVDPILQQVLPHQQEQPKNFSSLLALIPQVSTHYQQSSLIQKKLFDTVNQPFELFDNHEPSSLLERSSSCNSLQSPHIPQIPENFTQSLSSIEKHQVSYDNKKRKTDTSSIKNDIFETLVRYPLDKKDKIELIGSLIKEEMLKDQRKKSRKFDPNAMAWV